MTRPAARPGGTATPVPPAPARAGVRKGTRNYAQPAGRRGGFPRDNSRPGITRRPAGCVKATGRKVPGRDLERKEERRKGGLKLGEHTVNSAARIPARGPRPVRGPLAAVAPSTGLSVAPRVAPERFAAGATGGGHGGGATSAPVAPAGGRRGRKEAVHP